MVIARYGTSNTRIYAIMIGLDDKLIRNRSATDNATVFTRRVWIDALSAESYLPLSWLNDTKNSLRNYIRRESAYSDVGKSIVATLFLSIRPYRLTVKTEKLYPKRVGNECPAASALHNTFRESSFP